MNAELPPFENGEHNFESPFTLDRGITPLIKCTPLASLHSFSELKIFSQNVDPSVCLARVLAWMRLGSLCNTKLPASGLILKGDGKCFILIIGFFVCGSCGHSGSWQKLVDNINAILCSTVKAPTKLWVLNSPVPYMGPWQMSRGMVIAFFLLGHLAILFNIPRKPEACWRCRS